MPTGSIKKNKPTSWLDFNILLETVDLDYPIGHLCIDDIFFDERNATKKQWLYKEIVPPIIENRKLLM